MMAITEIDIIEVNHEADPVINNETIIRALDVQLVKYYQ